MRKFVKHSFVGLVATGIAFGYVGLQNQIRQYDKIQDQRMQGAPPKINRGWGNEHTNVMNFKHKYYTAYPHTDGI